MWRVRANLMCAYPGLSVQDAMSLEQWQVNLFYEEYKKFNKK